MNASRKLSYKSKESKKNGKFDMIASKSYFELSDKLKQLVITRIKVLEESLSQESLQNIQEKPKEILVGTIGGVYTTQWEVGVKILKHLCQTQS